MLENNFQTQRPSDRTWKLVDEGLYQVVLEDITPVQTEYQGEAKVSLRFQFLILDDEKFAGEKLFMKASPICTNFNNKPSWLFQIVQSIRKTEPSEQEIKEGLTGESLNALIGKQLLVMVKHNKSPNGQTYANIKGLMAAKKDSPLPKLGTKPPVAAPAIPIKIQEADEEAQEVPIRTEEDEVNAQVAGFPKQR